MIERSIIQNLRVWKSSNDRKPLVLRGARQVGKTTTVNIFAKEFKQYIYLNLERKEDAELFEKYKTIDELVKGIFFIKNKNITIEDTLIFIDEIQEVPIALNVLRYFFEDYPQYYVIAASSLLETLFNKEISFPVGRVEFMVVRPLSFDEFLLAMGEEMAYEQKNTFPINEFAHSKLLDLFHLYTLIGGMPEIVSKYAQTKDLFSLNRVYESLIISYLDDVEKYAASSKQALIMRHAIRSCFTEAGKRIKFQGFGNSTYSSREMGECLRIIEKAMLINLVFPTTQTNFPYAIDIKKSPRLQVLDTGMLNYFTGIQKQIFGTVDLNNIYQGIISEHIVGQELLANNYSYLNGLKFWVREKKDSTAELDFLVECKGDVYPIEVKSGSTGSLRSLHQFMEASSNNIAFRLSASKYSIDNITTPNKKEFKLINLPYYLSGNIKSYCP